MLQVQDFLTAGSTTISAQFFEAYGHMILQDGKVALRCRSLETGNMVEKFQLRNRVFEHSSYLSRNSIPSTFEPNVYYQGEPYLPAVDTVIGGVGLFQFTIAEKHPIKGVTVLTQICKAFTYQCPTQIPRFYFVVPKFNFKTFQKQKVEGS